MAKRQRELDQKDRTREREQRRNDRRSRIQERAGTAASTDDTTGAPPQPAGPVLGVDGPRSLAELLAQQSTPKPEE